MAFIKTMNVFRPVNNFNKYKLNRLFSSLPDEETSEVKLAIQNRIRRDIKNLQWRPPHNDMPDEFKSKFKLFANETENMDVITALQRPIDFSYSGIMEKRRKKHVDTERHMQQYIPQRHKMLGNDLATAHFIVHRGGSVKFVNKPGWIKMDEDEQYNLPKLYDAKWILEAVRCDDMELYYEGMENIKQLKSLKYISFRNVKVFDDWSLDRLAGSELTKLQILDISGTKVTANGLYAVNRLSSLREIIIDDVNYLSTEFELTTLMIQDLMPNLIFKRRTNDST